jgi:hypothetical protein
MLTYLKFNFRLGLSMDFWLQRFMVYLMTFLSQTNSFNDTVNCSLKCLFLHEIVNIKKGHRQKRLGPIF